MDFLYCDLVAGDIQTSQGSVCALEAFVAERGWTRLRSASMGKDEQTHSSALYVMR